MKSDRDEGSFLEYFLKYLFGRHKTALLINFKELLKNPFRNRWNVLNYNYNK